MQLVGAFAVCASGHCYVSRSFLEILASGECKKCWFLKTKTRFSHFETWFVQGLSIVSFVFSTTLLKPSRLILEDRRASARSFWRNLVLHILTNPVRLTLTKKVTFWGKMHCQFRCLRTTLWRLKLPLS